MGADSFIQTSIASRKRNPSLCGARTDGSMVDEPRMDDAFPAGGRRPGSGLTEEVAGVAIRGKREVAGPREETAAPCISQR
jgi:hypothetical protein